MHTQRNLRKLALAWVGISLLASCAAQERGEWHPQLGDKDVIPVLGHSASSESEITQMKLRIDAKVRGISISTSSSDTGARLTRPSDAVITSDSLLLVLDVATNSLRSFGPDGKYRRELLRQGGGPLEIQNAVGIELGEAEEDGSSPLIVATRSEIKFFRARSDSLEYLRSVRPPSIPLPSDACIAGERVYVRAALARGGGIITPFEDTVSTQSAFGRGYELGSNLAKEDLSMGPTVCSEEGGTVAAFSYLSWLSAFDRGGNVVWQRRIPDFKPLRFSDSPTSSGSPVFRRHYDEPGDIVLSLTKVDRSFALLQVGRLSAAKVEQPLVQIVQSRRNYLINMHSGESTVLAPIDADILAAGLSFLWTIEEGPDGFPVLVRYFF